MSPREYVLRDIPDWERAEDLDAYMMMPRATPRPPPAAMTAEYVDETRTTHNLREIATQTEPLRADFGGVGVAAEAAPRRALDRKASADTGMMAPNPSFHPSLEICSDSEADSVLDRARVQVRRA